MLKPHAVKLRESAVSNLLWENCLDDLKSDPKKLI